jgi:hypothetical protein
MKYSLSIVLWAALPLAIAGQHSSVLPLEITSTLFGKDHYLSANVFTGATRDSLGFRYFEGNDGVFYRYDGIGFKVMDAIESVFHFEYSLPANDFSTKIHYGHSLFVQQEVHPEVAYRWSVRADSLHCEWIRLHPLPGSPPEGGENRFVTIYEQKSHNATFALPEDLHAVDMSLQPSGNQCFVASQNHLFRFALNEQTWSPIVLTESVDELPKLGYAYLIGSHHFSAVFGIMRQSIFRLDPEPVRICRTSDKIFPEVTYEIIDDQWLYVKGEGTTIVEVNLVNGEYRSIDLTQYAKASHSSALACKYLKNYHNLLLIGTVKGGLLIYDRRSDSMQQVLHGQKYVDTDLVDAILWIMVDKEDVLWMQTEAGLIKLEINNMQMQ